MAERTRFTESGDIIEVGTEPHTRMVPLQLYKNGMNCQREQNGTQRVTLTYSLTAFQVVQQIPDEIRRRKCEML